MFRRHHWMNYYLRANPQSRILIVGIAEIAIPIVWGQGRAIVPVVLVPMGVLMGLLIFFPHCNGLLGY
jgi:hypothetical protein